MSNNQVIDLLTVLLGIMVGVLIILCIIFIVLKLRNKQPKAKNKKSTST